MTTETASTTERRGTAELVAAMVLSGTIGVFVVESGATPFTVVLYRCVFGAIALAAYCALRGFFRAPGFTLRTLGLTAVGGAFIVFNWAFLFEAYDRTSISLATIVYHTQPFYVVLLGAFIFRDQLTAVKLGWVVVAFGGLVLVTGLVTTQGVARDGDYVVGVLFALAAAVFYAFATIIAKRLKGIRPHLIALVQVLVGIPLLLPFVELGEATDIGSGWAWLVGLGVIHTCVMYVLMYASYQKLPTAKIAVLSFVYPAVAIVVDVAVYGTRIDAVQIFGILLIACASLGINLGWRLPLLGRSTARARAQQPQTVSTGATAPSSTKAQL